MKTGLKFFGKEVKQINNKNVTVVIENAYIDFMGVPGLMNAYKTCNAVKEYVDNHPNMYEVGLAGNPIMIFKGSGVAKCNPEDNFDEKIGFRIAETRAQRAIFKTVAKFYNDILKIIDESFYNDLIDKATNSYDSVYACNDHLDELFDR